MRRRDFIGLVGGAAAWPLAARAQEQKRVAVLVSGAASNPIVQSYLATFVQGLRRLGWVDGENLRLEVRWNEGDSGRTEAYATDLVGLFRPHVLLSVGSVNLIALKRATSTIPIVFVQVRDPVEQGLVQSLTNPGGNVTGFANSEFSIVGKWADLLKQMVPAIARIAVLFNLATSPQSRFYSSALQTAAPSLAVEIIVRHVRDAAEVEPTLASLAREPNIGLICLPDPTGALLKPIVASAAQYRLPAIYGSVDFINEGGLMYYGNDISEQFRQAAYYVDRILKGTKPGDLPVQLPTKFKLTVNRRTATALGIDVPLGLLLAADEVIE